MAATQRTHIWDTRGARRTGAAATRASTRSVKSGEGYERRNAALSSSSKGAINSYSFPRDRPEACPATRDNFSRNSASARCN